MNWAVRVSAGHLFSSTTTVTSQRKIYLSSHERGADSVGVLRRAGLAAVGALLWFAVKSDQRVGCKS